MLDPGENAEGASRGLTFCVSDRSAVALCRGLCLCVFAGLKESFCEDGGPLPVGARRRRPCPSIVHARGDDGAHQVEDPVSV